MPKSLVAERGRLLRLARPILITTIRERWLAIASLAAAGLLSGGLTSGFAALLSATINAASRGMTRRIELDGQDSWLTNAMAMINLVPNAVVAIFLCAILAGLVAYLTSASGRIRASLRAAMYRALREKAFGICFDIGDSAVKLDSPEASNRAVALTSSMNRGAIAVTGTCVFALTAAQQIVTLGTIAFSTGVSNLPIVLACGVVILVQIQVARLQAARLSKRRKDFDQANNRLQGSTADLISSRELVLAFDKAPNYKEKLSKDVADAAELERKNESAEAIYDALYELIERLGQLGVILVGVALEIGLGSTGDRSPVILALTLSASLLPSARSLISAYDSMMETESTVSSFLDIIESSTQDGKSQLISGWSEHQPIVLKNVSYFYPDAQAPAVENLSVTIPAGKVTLILGPSGCGKTTIGRMILGFLRPSTGDVVIGGREIGDWQLAYLHSFMSYGPQNDHILDATIEENMRLAENKRKFDGEELQNALKDVNLPADATGMARRAKSLSGGEIQRLSAARILLDTSEIVVLDEPMAGIDVFTMADIAGVIEKSWGGTPRTIVIISHKLVFAALASHIVILGKNCSIIEQGRPEELLAMEGEYARLRKEALRQVG